MHHYITTDVHAVIRWFYQAEQPTFFSSYHKKAGTLDECVQDTIDTLSDDSKFYVVEENGCMAAFFVKSMFNGMAVLEGFHVLPPFRSSLFLARFWDLVRTVFAQDIHVGILSSNTPALNHLQRNGFEVNHQVEYENKMFTLLTKKLSDKCH